MKKIYCVLLCLFCIASTMSITVSAQENNDFEYSTSGNFAEITRYVGKSKDVIIPQEIDGYTVREIGYHAFFLNSEIESVVIPDSVEEIGWSSFYECANLSRVQLGKNIKRIETSNVIKLR